MLSVQHQFFTQLPDTLQISFVQLSYHTVRLLFNGCYFVLDVLNDRPHLLSKHCLVFCTTVAVVVDVGLEHSLPATNAVSKLLLKRQLSLELGYKFELSRFRLRILCFVVIGQYFLIRYLV